MLEAVLVAVAAPTSKLLTLSVWIHQTSYMHQLLVVRVVVLVVVVGAVVVDAQALLALLLNSLVTSLASWCTMQGYATSQVADAGAGRLHHILLCDTGCWLAICAPCRPCNP